MPKFRKKPVVVEAEQFLGFYHSPWPPGVEVDQSVDGGTSLCVTTAHGQKATVAVGDWIIAEPDSRGFYPCKDDIFRSSYDPVCEDGGWIPANPERRRSEDV